MIKRLITLSAFILGAFLLLPITANAKEMTLKDYGKGFIMPADLKLTDEDGKIYKSPTMDPSLWAPKAKDEIEDLEETMELDNGMTAYRYWTKGIDGQYYPNVSLCDENNKEIFRAGRDFANNLVVFMEDEKGNSLRSTYSYTYNKYEDGKAITCSEDAGKPNQMEQYYADERRTYSEHYYYNPDEGVGVGEPSVSVHESYWGEDGFKESDGYIVDGEYVKVPAGLAEPIVFDDFEYTIAEPVTLTKTQWKACEDSDFKEGSHHICASYESLLAGQTLYPAKMVVDKVYDDGRVEKVEFIMHFTKEHIEMMEEKGIMVRAYMDTNSDGLPVAHYDVIKMECPLYLYDELFASQTVIVAKSPKAEEMFRKQEEIIQKKKDALVKSYDRQEDIANTEAKLIAETTDSNGNTEYQQPIVGDVPTINGILPVVAVTHIENGHTLVDFYDANWNRAAHIDSFENDYLNYKYVYFTEVAVLDNGGFIARLGGTDDPSYGGNLGGFQVGETETDNGMTGITEYYEQNWGAPENYGEGSGE